MAGPAELRDARGCDHMLIGGAMSRQAGEPRPSWGRTPSAIDGRGGRGLQLKADGSRAVEGTNKASAHVVLVDSFRGGVFQERKDRGLAQACEVGPSGPRSRVGGGPGGRHEPREGRPGPSS
ncbi:unnamed protein product [Prorocentrum cordatum]|uniref:Uncharacterized protein n=1 Tax=Prorocentrum cordatum TaxID=2364126 RepID=A0ABN9Y6D3_9DINO|nr:unnamed protein product [Polarella glacialis]